MSEPPALPTYTLWRDALAEVDEVFASPPGLDGPVDGCTYCTPESELRVLGGDPADVPDDLLEHFMREVAGHWDEHQYSVLWRRFLPRALRRWGPDGDGTDPSEVMGRLGRRGAQLADWPVAERAAVERAFRALLHVAVTDGRPYWEITGLMEESLMQRVPWSRGWTTSPGSPVPKRTPAWSASPSAGPPNSYGKS